MSIRKSELIQVLEERGFVNQSTNLDGLDERARTPIVGYIGFDLTSDSLHVGSLIQIMVLRWMKNLGHSPLAMLGRSTSLVGDPSGKNSSRPMLNRADIDKNENGIADVLTPLIGDCDFVSNDYWFEDMHFLDFLREFGPHFSINRMLAMDSVKSRLNVDGGSMSLLEFNYMVMQAVDFLKLNERDQCELQIGGSDQWGNIVNGVDLIRRIHNREVFGLTTPLMLNAAGEKMGKTANGAIWLDPTKTSANDFWQFWRNVDDQKIGEFLRLFTDMDLVEIQKLENLSGSEVNVAKKILANHVTTLIHGQVAAALAEANAQAVFELKTTNVGLNELVIDRVNHIGESLVDLVLVAGLVASKSAGQRMASQNGIRLNGKVITNLRDFPISDLDDEFTLAVGKRQVIKIKLI